MFENISSTDTFVSHYELRYPNSLYDSSVKNVLVDFSLA